MREGVSVHGMHVVNTVRTSLTEVTDEKVSLLLQVFCSIWWIVGSGYRRMGLYILHGKKCMYEGVVVNV